MSEACAWGTLRASAVSSAIVCSAAVITFDCGALATTIPRRVAASTSTLSTPTPARPTARSRSARAIRSVVSLVAERIRMPSNSPMRRSSSPSSQSVAELDVEAGVAQQRDARVADLLLDQNRGRRHAHAGAPAGTPASRNTAGRLPRRALLDVVAEVGQRHLQAGDGGEDVEGPEVAAVGDAADLALEPRLPTGDRDPVAVAHRRRHLGAVDALREPDGGADVGVLVLSAEQLEVERLDGGAGGAAQQAMALEHLLEALLLDQAERHVERLDEADRGREGAVRRVLALAVQPSAASRSSSGRPARSAARASAAALGLAKPSPAAPSAPSATRTPRRRAVVVLVDRHRAGAETASTAIRASCA